MTTYYPMGCGSEQSMGEYEEEYALIANAGLDDEEIYDDALRAPDPPIGMWRVRGGALLKISEMSNAHLKNAINLFARNENVDKPKILELKAELARREATP